MMKPASQLDPIGQAPAEGIPATSTAEMAEALRQSEAKFRLLADNVGEIFWFMELDPPRITYVSPSFERVWGLPVADLYADHECWERGIHPDDLPSVHARFHAWISGQTDSYQSEYRVRSSDGRIRWIADRGIVIGQKEGRPHHLSGIARDVTERRLAVEKFRGLLESAPDAMIIVDQRGLIEQVNAQAVNLFGYTREEMIGQPLEMLMPERFRGQHRHHRTGYAAAPHTRPMGAGRELFALRKDGSEFPTEISLSPMGTNDERIVISTVRDVTERKKIDEVLRVSEQRFRSFFENAAVGTAQVDVRGCFIHVNDRYCSITGYTREELLRGRSLLDLDHPADRERDRKWLLALLRGEQLTHDIEKRIICKDGAVRWVHVTAASMCNAIGEVQSTAAVIEDITQRKLAEGALKDSEARFRGFFENIGIGTVEVNANGCYARVNDHFCSMVGYSRKELLSGMSPRDLTHPDDDEQNRVHLERMLRGDCPVYEVERRYRRKDGQEIWVRGSATTIYNDDGTVRCFVGFAEDITERRQIEAALHASEQRLRLFVEHSPAPVAMFDSDMRYLVVSKRWANDFHLPDAPIIGRSHYEVFPDVPESWKQVHQRCLAGACESCERDRFPRADGTIDWVKWEIRPWFDVNGHIGGIIIFAEVINEQVRLQDEIAYARRFAESTLDAVPASLVVLDSRGIIVSTNNAWQDFARANGGNSESICKGVNYLAICDAAAEAGDSSAASFAAGIRDVMNGGSKRFAMEYPCHSDDQQRWFIGYVTPFMGNGPHSVVVAHVDISERKRAEKVIRRLNDELESRVEQRTQELRAANQQLRQEIAHRRQLEEELLHISEREQQRIGQDLHDDLGQQLAGVWLLSDVLKTNLAKEHSAQLENAEQITGLLKNALSLTRTLARGLHPVAVQSGGLIAALDELTDRTCEVFKVNCQCKCPEHIGLDHTTATHLYRIAQEAVTNAIKHGKANEINIELSTNPLHTILSVKDNGTGIGPEDLGHKGMGLRIMRYRADMIGGELHVHPRQDGDGTSVVCTVSASPRSTTAFHSHV